MEANTASRSVSDLDDLALASRPESRAAEEGIERAEGSTVSGPKPEISWFYGRMGPYVMPTEMKKDRYGAMVNITIPFSPWTAGKRAYEVEESWRLRREI